MLSCPVLSNKSSRALSSSGRGTGGYRADSCSCSYEPSTHSRWSTRSVPFGDPDVGAVESNM